MEVERKAVPKTQRKQDGVRVIAIVSWASATKGNWSTPSSWSGLAVPLATDDVLLDRSGPAYVILYDPPASTIASLTLTATGALLKPGANNTLTVQNAISLGAGSLLGANAGVTITAASFTETGGTLNWQAGDVLTIAGAANVSGGVFQTGGVGATIAVGSLSISGNGQFGMGNGTVSVAGLAQFDSTVSQSAIGTLSAGTLSIGAIDTFVMISPTDLLEAGAGGLSVLGTLIGSGTVKAAVTGTGTIAATGIAGVANATLNVQGNIAAGVVLAVGTVSSGGSLATLKLDGVAEALQAVSLTSFLQTLEIGATGTLTIDQSQTVSGSAAIQLDGGTLIDAHGLTIGAVGSVNIGNINGFGLVAASIDSGVGTAAGGFLFANGGTLEVTGSIGGNVAMNIGSTVSSVLKLDGTVEATYGFNNASIAAIVTSANQTLEIGATAAVFIDIAQTVIAGTILLDGGRLTDSAGIFLGDNLSAGTIVGTGTILAPILNGGSVAGNIVTASGGTLSLIGSIASGVTLAISNLSPTTLQIGNTESIATAIGIANANQTLRIINTGALTIGQAETVAAGTVVLAGGNLLDPSGIVLGSGAASGSIVGFGGVQGTITAAGSGGNNTIAAQGGSLILASGVGSGISLHVDTGARLKLDSTIGAGDIVTFLNSIANSGTIQLANSIAASSFASNATVAGMAVGVGFAATDVVDFLFVEPGSVGSASVVNGTTVNIWSGLGGAGTNLGQFTLAAPTTAGVSFQSDGAGGTEVFLVCFAGGTGIRTVDGDIPVETVRPGDLVAVREDGRTFYKPVVWVGVRHLDLTDHPRPELLAPVRIRCGALGPGLPEKDLLLSPDHCLLLDDKLVPAKLLLNGMTVLQERSTQAVSYYHVELAHHGVLLAEGLPVESYLDTGNRAFFSNAGLALLLHPEFHVNAGLKCWDTDACAPLAVSHSAVAPIWERIAARAVSLGFQRPDFVLTSDPDVHLIVDGKPIYPIAVHAGRHSFALPRCARSVRLMSRADIPGDLYPALDDWRRLGVCCSGMTLRDTDAWRDIPADHPDLRSGWHKVERDATGFWRWTDGAAVLPIETGECPAILDIAIEGSMSYRLHGPEAARRLAA